MLDSALVVLDLAAFRPLESASVRVSTVESVPDLDKDLALQVLSVDSRPAVPAKESDSANN